MSFSTPLIPGRIMIDSDEPVIPGKAKEHHDQLLKYGFKHSSQEPMLENRVFNKYDHPKGHEASLSHHKTTGAEPKYRIYPAKPSIKSGRTVTDLSRHLGRLSQMYED